MSGQRPLPTQWHALVEGRIRRALEEGEFENLPGAGKPIPDLDAPYDELWWVKKWMQRERLGALPESLRFKREVAETIERLQRRGDEASVRAELENLNARIRKANATMVDGPAVNLACVDVEAFLARRRVGAGPPE